MHNVGGRSDAETNCGVRITLSCNSDFDFWRSPPATEAQRQRRTANRKAPVRRYGPRYAPRTLQNPWKHWLGTAGTAVRPESYLAGGKSSVLSPRSSALRLS